MISRASFQELSIDHIRDWMQSRKQEDLHLDFKLVSAPSLNRDDRKNLAIAVSGFANSDGGLIVWGVNCRRDDTGVDAATETPAMTNVGTTLAALQSLTGDAVSPVVDGVEHRALVDRTGSGYVATLVPSSERGPHMAGLGESRYYKRAGDSFYRMEHFDVADMFGRRSRPDLRVELTPRAQGAGTSLGKRNCRVKTIVTLSNVGRGIARFPFLKLRAARPYAIAHYELDGNGNPGLPRLTQAETAEGWRAYAGGANQVVHAGATMDVTLIEVKILEDQLELPDLVLEFFVTCEGARPHAGQVIVAASDIIEMVRKEMDRCYPKSV